LFILTSSGSVPGKSNFYNGVRVVLYAMPPRNILLIQRGWCELILRNEKSWELRNKACHKRGRIGIACSAGSSPTGKALILGEVTLKDCLKVGVRQDGFLTAPAENPHNYMFLRRNVKKHHVKNPNHPVLQGYNQVFAWVMEDAMTYPHPIELPPKRGRVVWATYDAPS